MSPNEELRFAIQEYLENDGYTIKDLLEVIGCVIEEMMEENK